MDKENMILSLEKDLNSQEIIDKLIALGKEKGIRYSNIKFSDIRIINDKIFIKIIMQ